MTDQDNLEREGMSRHSGRGEEKVVKEIKPEDMSFQMTRVQKEIETLDVKLAAARQKNKEKRG